jgi:acylglycerol lipase
MQSAMGTLTGQQKVRLTYGQWYPDGDPKAVVLIVHGMGEHMGRYKHVIDTLVERGYACFAIDHRGHGQSQGTRAHIEKFTYYVDDLELLYKTAHESHPTLPFFMLGHSLGGLITVHFLLRHQDKLRGAVISAPALVIGEDASPMLKRVSHFLMRVVPKLPILPPTGDNMLSHDPDIDRLWKEDPLTYDGSVRVSMGNQMMIAAEAALQRLHEIRLPLLLMHGTDDKMTNPKGSELFYKEAQSKDKTIKLWDDMYHEIFNEVGKSEVIQVAADWLDQRV